MTIEGMAPTCPRHCERSEAIHIFFSLRDGLLRFARNDGGQTRLRIPAAHCARVDRRILRPDRGRRECRVLAAPAVSRAICAQEHAHEHTGTVGASRHSPHNGFTAYIVLSPATNSSCHRRWRINGFAEPGWACENLRRLDTSNGCQDHTVLPSASASFVWRASIAHGRTALRSYLRARRCRVHRISSQRI
jgi:hypothetical protein